jgi:long-chain acyl-CoA synthetase
MLSHFDHLTAESPEAPALIDAASGAVITRRGLAQRGESFSRQLAGLGLSRGDVVAVRLPNGPEFVAATIAIFRAGMTLVPIDRDATETEVASILHHFGAQAFVYQPSSEPGEERSGRTLSGMSRVESEAGRECLLIHDKSGRGESGPELSTSAGESIGAWKDSREPNWTNSGHSGEPIQISPLVTTPRVHFGHPLVKLTSGSTGLPKGIVTSEENLVADCTSICATMGITPDDVNLGAIPFSHSYGFSNLVTPLLLQGTPVVFTNQYIPLSILAIANRYRCSVLPGIPMLFDHLAQLPLEDGTFESVRTYISAGAPLQAATSRRFRERFGVAIQTFYGCSESGGIAFDRQGGSVERGSVGLPLDGVRLSREADGRLIVESRAVAVGYFDPLHGEIETFTPAGRFVADDLVQIDASGELSIEGRVGDLINAAGKKVNPREVEAVILQLEGVQQVKVYGSEAGARGQVVAAAIVASPDVTRETIRRFCRERLSGHKVPRIIKLIDTLPVDERGKVRRSALAAL